jgi:hypothetical protein
MHDYRFFAGGRSVHTPSKHFLRHADRFRQRGVRPGNDEIAIAKATTSAMSCRPSAVWEKWVEARTRLMRPLRSLLRRAGWGIFGVHHLPASFTSVHSTQVEPNLTFCLRSANLEHVLAE